MKKRTSAACLCPFDETAIPVNVGRKHIKVGCSECASALNKAAGNALPEG